MLVLSRKQGEKLLIDGGIELVIVEISGDKVRVGINAPKHVKVNREEVAARIAEEGNRRHAKASI